MCNFPSILFHLCACTISAPKPSFCSCWLAKSVWVMAYTAPVEGRFVHYMVWMRGLNARCFAPNKFDYLHLFRSSNMTVVFLLMFAMHPLALRVHKALCHLMHYSTDLCPPPPSPTPLCRPRPVSCMWAYSLECNASGCVDWIFGVIIPGLSVHDILLCHKLLSIWGFIFLCHMFVLFFFYLKVKDVYCTVLYWPVS